MKDFKIKVSKTSSAYVDALGGKYPTKEAVKEFYKNSSAPIVYYNEAGQEIRTFKIGYVDKWPYFVDEAENRFGFGDHLSKEDILNGGEELKGKINEFISQKYGSGVYPEIIFPE